MKVGLLGTGLGIAHAHLYHAHPQVSEVVVFGRTPAKLQAFTDKFGYAATTDPATIYDDPTIDLVDVCLPTGLHAEHVTRALAAGKHVLCELPLAATMDDARRIAEAAAASDRQVFVDMFGRFDPATEFLHAAIAEGRYGTLKTLAIELRSALLWEGYQIGLDSIAMDVLHSTLDTIVTALGRPESMAAMGVAKGHRRIRRRGSARLPGRHRALRRLVVAAQALWDAGRLPGQLHRRDDREQLDRRLRRPPHHHPDRVHRAGQREIDLAARDAYGAVIDHVIACCQGHDSSRLSPASVLDTLQLTFDVRATLTAAKPS